MGRRNLKHGKADEISEDILYLITKRSCVVMAALKHLIMGAALVLLPSSQKLIPHRLVASHILTLNMHCLILEVMSLFS